MLKIIKWFRSPARSNTRLVLVVLLSLFLFAQAGDPSKCAAQGSCPEPAAYGRQPYPNELVDAFERASTNRLGGVSQLCGEDSEGLADLLPRPIPFFSPAHTSSA